MHKIKVSKSEVKNNNYRILGVGYCKMQYLLQYQQPTAYSAGAYGWSCDYYDINNVVISTGYNRIHSQNMKDDYDLIKQYEDRACSIVCDNHYQNSKEAVNKLLLELLEKLKKWNDEKNNIKDTTIHFSSTVDFVRLYHLRADTISENTTQDIEINKEKIKKWQDMKKL